MHIAQLNSIDIREGGLQIAKHIYLPDNLVRTLLPLRTAWLSSLASLQEQEELNSCDGPYLLVPEAVSRGVQGGDAPPPCKNEGGARDPPVKIRGVRGTPLCFPPP